MEQDHIVLEKFLNILIKQGKKEQALKIVLIVLKFLNIKKKKKKTITGESLVVKAVTNIIPQVYVEKQRKSRRIFYFPKLISAEKKISVAVH